MKIRHEPTSTGYVVRIFQKNRRDKRPYAAQHLAVPLHELSPNEAQILIKDLNREAKVNYARAVGLQGYTPNQEDK